MSGTSLDGISAAAVRFGETGGAIAHELLAFRSVPYTVTQRERLQAATSEGSAREYCELGFEIGEWLATAATEMINATELKPGDVRAIASHGQTIWHVPRRSTLQLGESAVIAERTGIDVIADFRVRDVAAGGEGAPLVPMADAMLYASPKEWRLLQNIGGIGNVTVVPPEGRTSHVRAFDTGPGVVLIDHVVRFFFPQLRFDEGGAIARAGHSSEAVVESLLRDPYFSRTPPKSTGREYFGADFA
ncbi:MAG: anhydro-N-acetylmuramic acid kinase, partial [Gemmatimonadota bacterium]|nr:anhydro-N-acetylmuramic acid kinase [Gemmatimonadota bacterium]